MTRNPDFPSIYSKKVRSFCYCPCTWPRVLDGLITLVEQEIRELCGENELLPIRRRSLKMKSSGRSGESI
jgi:hypothetical protein